MVIIIGDSWGVGEVGVDGALGPGIGQYISLNDKVINLSGGGLSNTECLDRLAHLFEQFNPEPVDRFFWIVTCPCRCLPFNNYTALKNITVTDLAEQLLYKALDAANTLAHCASIKIELIGGMCDLNEEHVEYFENLELLVPSWGTLLDPQYPKAPFVANPVLFEHTARDESALLAMERKYNYWQSNEYYPDAAHPNKMGHFMLRNAIFPGLPSRVI